MNKNVTVRMPRNVAPEEEQLFAPNLQYQLPALRTKRFKNVFVCYSGLAANYQGLMPETHHVYPDQLPGYLNEITRFYKLSSDDPDELINLNDDQTYLLIHHPWFNYYHWLCESIFRLWKVRHRISELVLLLPDYYKTSDFIMGSLEPFKFKAIFFIPAQKSLLVKNLCLPPIKRLVDSYNSTDMTSIAAFYKHYVTKKRVLNLNLGERLYISRQKASRKKVINEEEVVAVISKFQFKILFNEDYSFLDQISIFSHANCLVSIHGSGLTNMMFMQPGSSVLELHKKVTNNHDWHSFAFWYQADCLGYDYYQQLCEPGNPEDDYFHADYYVDINLLSKNLEAMCNKV